MLNNWVTDVCIMVVTPRFYSNTRCELLLRPVEDTGHIQQVPGLRRSQDKVELGRFYMFTFCPNTAVFSWTFRVQEECVSLNWLI